MLTRTGTASKYISFMTAVSFAVSVSFYGVGLAANGAGGTFVQGNVTGTALDTNGRPASGQEVKIYNSKGDLVTTVTSGSDGTFSLNNLPPGNYSMVINNTTASLTIAATGSAEAAGAATAFKAVIGPNALVGATYGLAGIAVAQWIVVGGVVVLGGFVASSVIKKNKKAKSE